MNSTSHRYKDGAAAIIQLASDLNERCQEQGLVYIDGLTVMFDDEQGRTVRYVREMPLSHTGSMHEFYDKNSEHFERRYDSIYWPYTGFVQGNMAGWVPISVDKILTWLHRFSYSLEEFLVSFRRD